MNFPERLRHLRIRKGALQKDLADLLGISVHGYQNYEYGIHEPALSNLIALADFYNISLDELAGRGGPYETMDFEVNDMAKSTLELHLDENLVQEAEEIFDALGLDLETAVRVFLKKAVAEQGLPFDLRTSIPESETREVLEEMRRMEEHPEEYKRYSTFREGLEDVLGHA